VKHLGKTIYLPLSIDTEYVKQFKQPKSKRKGVAFAGRSSKKSYPGVTLPYNVRCLSGMARDELLAELAQLQKDILRSAVPYLKEGGVLIYSTCTINKGENEETAEFIEKEMGLRPDPLAPYLPDTVPGIRGNQLQLLPHVHGTDGFFLARFVKIKPDDQEET
jgi:hypothetical protein